MIWATVQNQSYDVASADALTSKLPPVKTNYNLGNKESILQYKYGDEAHRVRPTSGMEFISSSHFPDEVQGDMLLANSIWFLGLKQHQMMEDGTGYTSKHRQDLITSNDPNFRPVEMVFAPDSSLYIVDWHNVLIGHMQHNARDSLRDYVHGRIYRITYPSRPLVKPAKVFGQQWITHHGHFDDGKFPVTDISIVKSQTKNPILNGFEEFEAYSWLYHVDGGDWKLQGDSEPLLMGHSTKSQHEIDGDLDKFSLDNPVAWTKSYTGNSGNNARVFFATLGHPYDFKIPVVRKIAMNGIYWALGKEGEIPEDVVNVVLDEPFLPNNSGFGQKFKKNKKPTQIQ
ncbi:MAG: hypothetical protein V7734_09685 [Maribacter arcticus]|uniref:DUF7133 domain-containing protein n=2 Tax=Maribacter arcticus TaxID=561365 RepID=UPI0030014AEE